VPRASGWLSAPDRVIVITAPSRCVLGDPVAGHETGKTGAEVRGCEMVSALLVVFAAARLGAAVHLRRLGWK